MCLPGLGAPNPEGSDKWQKDPIGYDRDYKKAQQSFLAKVQADADAARLKDAQRKMAPDAADLALQKSVASPLASQTRASSFVSGPAGARALLGMGKKRAGL